MSHDMLSLAALVEPGAWTRTLLLVSLKGGVLLSAVAVANLLLRRQPAASRSLLWVAALSALMLLLPAGGMLPSVKVASPELQGVEPLLRFASGSQADAPGPSPSTRAQDRGDSGVASAPGVTGDVSGGVAPTDSRARAEGANAPTIATFSADPGPSAAGHDESPRVTGTFQPAEAGAAGVASDWGLARALGLIWLAGAIALWARLLWGVARVRALGARARPVIEEEWTELLGTLSLQLGVRRRVRLLTHHECRSPMTWGLRSPVILLPPSSHHWIAERRRDVLLHELAHIRRRDYLGCLLAHAACATFWFHPLVWWAARELEREQELACDDQVLAAGSRPSDYASHLLDIARSLRPSRFAAPATIAMAHPSQLPRRVRSILDPGRRHGNASGRARLVLGLCVLALLLPLASLDPVLAGGRIKGFDDLEGNFFLMDEDDGDNHGRWILKKDDYILSCTYHGEFELSDDERRIVGLQPGGYLILEEEVGREYRRLEVENDDSGAPVFTYHEGDGEEPFDADAREWLAEALRTLILESGIGAEERVVRIRAESGVEGVLDEVREMNSGHVRQQYLIALLQGEPLTDAELSDFNRVLDRELDSDYEKREVLIQYPLDRLAEEGAVRQGFFDVVEDLGSDYEKRQVLQRVLDESGVDPSLGLLVLDGIVTLESDYEKAALLTSFDPEYAADPQVVRAWFRALSTLESDYEMGTCLSALMEVGIEDPQVLTAVATMIVDLDSDHEKGKLLAAYAHLYRDDPELRAAYQRALDSLDSDYEYRKASEAFYRE